MALSSILIWSLVGGTAGYMAEWLIGDVRTGCLSSIFIGVVGALIGGWLFIYLGFSIGTRTATDVVTSAVGAVALLLLVKFIRWD
jgi:uncharacterized membrane protein YeaQ/YmgE (transglycosylase-associated protein family)